MTTKQTTFELVSHPMCGALGAAAGVTVSVSSSDAELRVSYELKSRIRIKVPGLCGTHAGRFNELWLRTCCELFVRDPKRPEPYLEFNFSPAGDWAFYAFDGTLRGMRSPPWPQSIRAPEVRSRMDQRSGDHFPHRLVVDVTIPRVILGSASELFPTVVLETHAGTSLWAIWHPIDRPHFHHPDNFLRAVEVP
jgi:hypothetical protein